MQARYPPCYFLLKEAGLVEFNWDNGSDTHGNLSDTNIRQSGKASQILSNNTFAYNGDASFNWIPRSNQLVAVYSPYVVLSKVIDPQNYLKISAQSKRMSYVEELREYRESLTRTRNQFPRYQLFIREITSERGISIREAFQLMPLDNKYIVMALTLDASSYIRLYQISETCWELYTNKTTHGLLLRLASVLPKLFEAFAADPAVVDMAQLLFKKEADAYYDRLYPWLTTTAAVMERKIMLEKFKTSMSSVFDYELEATQAQVHNTKENIEELERNLLQYYTSLRKLMDKEIVLMSKGTPDYDTLIQFVTSCKYIQEIRQRDTYCFDFRVLVPCNNFEPDMARYLIDSDRTTRLNGNARVKRACTELFLNQSAILWLNVRFSLDFVSGEVKGVDDVVAPGCWNHHIHQHNCWGNNKTPIIRAVQNKQYEAALAQCFSACSNINFTDGIVIDGWFGNMQNQRDGYNKKCIEVPGIPDWFTWSAYLEYLEHPPIVVPPTPEPEPVVPTAHVVVEPATTIIDMPDEVPEEENPFTIDEEEARP